MTQIKDLVRIKEYKWKDKAGRMIPLSKITDDRLIVNYHSVSERLENRLLKVKDLKGKEKFVENAKCRSLEITKLAVEQELDKRNILIQ